MISPDSPSSSSFSSTFSNHSSQSSQGSLDDIDYTYILRNLPPPVALPFQSQLTLAQCLHNPSNTTNVYIRGLAPTITDDALHLLVSQFGKVGSSKAIIDTMTGECKGFGFVQYSNESECTRCIVTLTELGYQASYAKESFSARLQQLSDPNNTNLYLSNLPPHISEHLIQTCFPDYTIVSARILRTPEGVSCGVGFARLTSREIADKFIDEFNGTFPFGGESPLAVRYADSAQQRKLKGNTAARRFARSLQYNMLTRPGYYAPPISQVSVAPMGMVMPMSPYNVGSSVYAPPSFMEYQQA